MAARVLVPRPQAEPLAGLLQARGLVPVHVPLIELAATGRPPPPGTPTAAFITSPAVARLAPAVAQRFDGVPIVSVGAATSASLRALGLDIAAEGDGTGAGSLRLLEPWAARGAVWHVGAEVLSPSLLRALAAWDGRVVRWPVYRNQPPDDLPAQLGAALPVDVVIFTAGSMARHFVDAVGRPQARVVAIGTPTATVCAELGVPVYAVAPRPTMADLADTALSAADG